MESIRDMLLATFMQEWNQTSKLHKDECADWTEFYNHWIDLMKSIIEIVPDSTKRESLVLVRFLELNRDILWSLFATMVGAYETAVRELRFLLEALLQAYLVDNRGGLSKLSDHVERITGNRLIGACNFGEPYESSMRNLYKELCQYVHPTRQELSPFVFDPRVSFYYDNTCFLRNRELHRKTSDAILFIVMSAFPKAAKHYSEKHLTWDSLMELNLELSMEYLKNLQI
ncbi:MAG: hypothetical protein JW779_05555 [Candidatus Thorarchaeota archaeon]|nr:hypothetical protein [Candidatus Thorarchaeota archaeon]